jgi:predicted acylesterase/phospholipase RssA
MEDEGLPIDMIGGCSIGAFIGGLYAKDGTSGSYLFTSGLLKGSC